MIQTVVDSIGYGANWNDDCAHAFNYSLTTFIYSIEYTFDCNYVATAMFIDDAPKIFFKLPFTMI